MDPSKVNKNNPNIRAENYDGNSFAASKRDLDCLLPQSQQAMKEKRDSRATFKSRLPPFQCFLCPARQK